MKKYLKISGLVLGGLIVLIIIFGNIDYHSRVKKDQPPILSIYIGKDKNTGAKIWLGLGYTVTKCPELKLSPDIISDNNKYKMHLLSKMHICSTGYDIIPIEE